MGAFNNQYDVQPLDAKVWAAINAVLPFTQDGRVILRPGLIRTHPNRHFGAAIEVKEATATFDVVGKQFLALAEVATNYAVAGNGSLMVVFGDNSRGIVAGLAPLPDEGAPATNWGDPTGSTQSPQGGGDGWPGPSSIQMVAPQPEGDRNPDGKWKNGPKEGDAQSPEFQSTYLDQPEDNFRDDDAYLLVVPGDTGFPLNTAQPQGFSASGWVNSLSDEDGGLANDDTDTTNNNGW
jgi:hypothetical protein